GRHQRLTDAKDREECQRGHADECRIGGKKTDVRPSILEHHRKNPNEGLRRTKVGTRNQPRGSAVRAQKCSDGVVPARTRFGGLSGCSGRRVTWPVLVRQLALLIAWESTRFH